MQVKRERSLQRNIRITRNKSANDKETALHLFDHSSETALLGPFIFQLLLVSRKTYPL